AQRDGLVGARDDLGRGPAQGVTLGEGLDERWVVRAEVGEDQLDAGKAQGFDQRLRGGVHGDPPVRRGVFGDPHLVAHRVTRLPTSSDSRDTAPGTWRLWVK